VFEKRLGILQVGSVEALGKLFIDFGKHRASLIGADRASPASVWRASVWSYPVSPDGVGLAMIGDK
jgi:hypothetical protein